MGEGVGCTIPVPHLIKRVCALEAPAQGNLGKKALSKVWTCTFKTGRGYIFVEEPCTNEYVQAPTSLMMCRTRLIYLNLVRYVLSLNTTRLTIRSHP